ARRPALAAGACRRTVLRPALAAAAEVRLARYLFPLAGALRPRAVRRRLARARLAGVARAPRLRADRGSQSVPGAPDHRAQDSDRLEVARHGAQLDLGLDDRAEQLEPRHRRFQAGAARVD